MKKRGLQRIVIAVCCITATSSAAWGWGSFPGDTHKRLASKVLSHPSMQPYVSRFSDFGLDLSTIVNIANTEPDPHYGYSLFTGQGHRSLSINNTNLGSIIHVACDSGVAANHAPAGYIWNANNHPRAGKAEDIFELKAELVSIPSLTGLYTGTYAQKLDTFYQDQLALTYTYKAWCESKSDWEWLFPSPPTSYVEQGMVNGMRFTQMVLTDYFEHHGIPEPGTVVVLTVCSVTAMCLRRSRRLAA